MTNRAEVIAYIAAEHSQLLAEARMPTTDTPAGLKLPADQTFLRVGIEAGYLAAAEHADTLALYALADYYTLRRIARAIAARTDLGAPAVEGDRPRTFEHISKLIEQAAGDCAAQGYPVGKEAATEGAGWTFGAINLDIVEPEIG